MMHSCACRIARLRGGAATTQLPRLRRVTRRRSLEAGVLLLLLLPCSLRWFAMRKNSVTLLRLPRSAAAEILLWLAEHEAYVADNDLRDFAATEF